MRHLAAEGASVVLGGLPSPRAVVRTFYAEFSDVTNTSGGPVFTPETRVVCA